MKRCPIKNQKQQHIIREKEEGRQKPSTVVTAVSLKLSHHEKQIDNSIPEFPGKATTAQLVMPTAQGERGTPSQSNCSSSYRSL